MIDLYYIENRIILDKVFFVEREWLRDKFVIWSYSLILFAN